MNRSCLASALFTVAASVAHAADPAVIELPKNMEFSAELTLIKADGSKPKMAPLKTDHAVELRFDDNTKSTHGTVPCTLNIPKKVGQIAAGDAAVIGLKCGEVVKMPRDKLGFVVLDNGREIGSGAFRP